MAIDPLWDLLLTNGRVGDGTGGPWFRADVAVRGDRIAAVAPDLPPRARAVMDVAGLAVAPGFIDMHSHNDLLHMASPDRGPTSGAGLAPRGAGRGGVGGHDPPPARPEEIAAMRPLVAESMEAGA